MKDQERERIAALSGQDPELQSLWKQHLDFERQLEEYDALPHLTPDEERERKQIQKLKLAGKDKIVEILAQHPA